MKWFYRIFIKIKKFLLRLIGTIVIEKLIGQDDIAVEIDSNEVYLIRSDAYNIGIVFKDGTLKTFPLEKPNNWDNFQKLSTVIPDPFTKTKNTSINKFTDK